MSFRRLSRTLAAGLTSLALAACGNPEAEEGTGRSTRRIAAETAVAQLVGSPRVLEATGTVEPSRRAVPGTKILGRVASMPVREGERVAAGDLLARLDDADLRAAADRARAGVAMAEARLENAEAQRRRMQDLRDRGSVTEKNLEDAVAGERVARAGLDEARAALRSAEVTLAYAAVHSPFGGWVTAKHVEVGDLVAPGQPMLTVEALVPAKVVVDVPEGEVRHLSVGQRVRLVVDALGGDPADEIEAEIDRVVPSGDRRARTFEVQMRVPNADGRLKSGMFARARFELGPGEVLRLPREALVRRGQLEGVFVVDAEERARLRWVRTGETQAGEVEVLSGLEEGERYVVAPPPALVDGTLIESPGGGASR